MVNELTEPDLGAEKRKLLAETRADLLKRQLSNAENYDKAILSLSVAFLGLSLTFLKDFVPVHLANWPLLLYASWWLFALAVLATLSSYLVSQWAVNEQLRRAEEYYLHDKVDALERSMVARATDWLNVASGLVFVLGIVLTTVFVTANVEGASRMATEKKPDQIPLTEGAPIPNLQQAPLERGAPIPNLQQSPPPAQEKLPPSPNEPQPQSAPNTPQAGNSQQGGANK